MRIDTKKIWEEVKENHRTLNTCPCHDFQKPEGVSLLERYTCTKCGGKLDSINVLYYKLGLQHGRCEGAEGR